MGEIKRVRLDQTDRRLAAQFTQEIRKYPRRAKPETSAAVAKNPDIWRRLAKSPHFHVVKALCEQELPEDVISFLQDYNESDIRQQALRRLPITQEAFARICSESPSDAVSLARRVRLSRAQQLLLLSSNSFWVRSALAENECTDEDLVLQLCQDNEKRVRKSAATRKGLPKDVLVALGKDQALDVRESALRNPEMTPGFLEKMLEVGRGREIEAIAGNSNLPRALQLKICETGAVESVSRLLGSKREIATELYESVVKNPNWGVRSLAVLDKRIPSDIVEMLMEDPDGRIREMLAGLRHLTEEQLNRLGNDPSIRVRTRCAANPHTGVETLARLARDPFVGVRRAVGGNMKSLPEDIRVLLLEDSEPSVVKAAANRGQINSHRLKHHYSSQCQYHESRDIHYDGALTFTYQGSYTGREMASGLPFRKAAVVSKFTREIEEWPVVSFEQPYQGRLRLKEADQELTELTVRLVKESFVYPEDPKEWNQVAGDQNGEATSRRVTSMGSLSGEEKIESQLPIGWRPSGGEWMLIDQQGRGYVTDLPENFDGLGRVAGEGGRGVFASPGPSNSATRGIQLEWWAVEARPTRSSPRGMKSFSGAFQRKPSFAERLRSQGVDAQLMGTLLCNGGIYGLWGDSDGLIGWTYAESANIPQERRLYRKDLIGKSRIQLLDKELSRLRQLTAGKLSL